MSVKRDKDEFIYLDNVVYPKHNKLIKTLESSNGLLVLEDITNRQESNLYLLDNELSTIWTAELPHESDYFISVEIDKNGTIICSTWNGLTCEISKDNGEILSKRDSR